EGPRERERRYLRAKFDADPRPLEDRPVPRGYVLAGERIRRDGFLAGVRDLLIGPSAVPEEGDWLFVGPPREWVFDGLIPRRYVELVRELDVGRLDAVRKFLADEELSEYELALEPTARRDYPTGDHGVFGAWEWWQPTELGSLLLPEPSEEQQADDQAEQEPRVLRPTRGLENLGYLALLDVEEEFGDPRVADSAHWRTRSALWDDPPDQAYAPHLVAGSADRFERLLLRPRRPGEPRDYFMHRENGLDPAIVESTLDLDLQRRLGAALGDLLEEQQAALAMAVVLDLESREVLALDWAAKYASIAFPPLQHTFTPGSTFKLVTAGLALELGKVRADEVFDVGQGEYVVRDRRPSGRVRTRTVHEAEGYARGRITAAQCVARSSNAGMVQIGHRISVDQWKSMTGLLGYGTPAADGLIARGLSNAAGRVGELKRDSSDPWALTRSHTSVPFGDSVTTTLLQHAQSLAALTDDGVLRPLRFLRAWRVGERRFEFPAQAGQRVVSPAVSAELRAMMRLGAESGTGKNLERPEGLVLHTKTGTTEKLSSD
ncbi:MAG: penicillin-binding transpeptidase domain-containing protein, partial [Planctomycetota bacterium]